MTRNSIQGNGLRERYPRLKGVAARLFVEPALKSRLGKPKRFPRYGIWLSTICANEGGTANLFVLYVMKRFFIVLIEGGYQ